MNTKETMQVYLHRKNISIKKDKKIKQNRIEQNRKQNKTKQNKRKYIIKSI